MSPGLRIIRFRESRSMFRALMAYMIGVYKSFTLKLVCAFSAFLSLAVLSFV